MATNVKNIKMRAADNPFATDADAIADLEAMVGSADLALGIMVRYFRANRQTVDAALVRIIALLTARDGEPITLDVRRVARIFNRNEETMQTVMARLEDSGVFLVGRGRFYRRTWQVPGELPSATA